MPAGLALGKCEEVVRAGSPEGQCESLQENSTEVPLFLRDLRQRSTACLTEQQAVRVERLLVNYADVFSQGDHDLGRTSLVKHRIHTGNSAPVKEPPRRIAPTRSVGGSEDEEEDMVEAAEVLTVAEEEEEEEEPVVERPRRGRRLHAWSEDYVLW